MRVISQGEILLVLCQFLNAERYLLTVDIPLLIISDFLIENNFFRQYIRKQFLAVRLEEFLDLRVVSY